LTLTAFYFGMYEHGYNIFTSLAKEVTKSSDYQTALTYARTMAFVVLAASQLFYSLSMRNHEKSIFKIGLFKNKLLIASIIIGLLLQELVISIPFLAEAFGVHNISLKDWGIVLLFSLVPLTVNELIKFFVRLTRKTADNN
jgi:Ca2+-transporting ATPase